MQRDLVVIGGSSGGIDAVTTILRALPRDLPAALCVVLHTSADGPGFLGTILEHGTNWPVVTVTHAQRIVPGKVHVPVPDHHLIIEPGIVRVARGPKENRFRPAVDPLFRSAAQVYGPRVIGVILTGGLDDGTAGLWAVKQLGGTSVVQDPEDALVDSMPASALRHVRVDHCVPLVEIAPLLARLTKLPVEERLREVPEPIAIEVNVAKEDNALDAGVLKLGAPSNYACPECHGVLLQFREGERTRFRCHTGHAYSVASLLSDFDDAIDVSLWNAVRSLEEKMLFLKHLSSHADDTAEDDGSTLTEQTQATEERAHLVRKALGTGELEDRNGN